ncbi:hypothetical protein IW136_006192, partial [Coemansia sp. RSA 678]
MFVRAFSLLAIAALACASPVHVRKGDVVPSEIAHAVAQVAQAVQAGEVIDNPKFTSTVTEAAVNVINVHNLPKQEPADASIMPSFFSAISSLNNPDVVTATAKLAPLLKGDNIPTKVIDLAKSILLSLEDSKANHNIAGNIKQMISYIEGAKADNPGLYEDGENKDDKENEDGKPGIHFTGNEGNEENEDGEKNEENEDDEN